MCKRYRIFGLLTLRNIPVVFHSYTRGRYHADTEEESLSILLRITKG